MKKILVITPFFAPHIGGSQRYMEELYATLLKNHPDTEVGVLCYNTDKQKARETYRGMRIYRIPCVQVLRGQFCLPEPLSLLRFLLSKEARSYDVIHCSTRFFESSWWGVLYAKLIKRKAFLTDHCAANPAHPNRFIRAIAKSIDLITGRIFLPLYDHIFVVSHETQEFLKQVFGVSSEVMYAGVDVRLFHPSKKKKRSKPKVVYVGRMIASKGVEDLFEVAKDMPEVDFVLAGPGELGEKLRKEAASLRLEHIAILPALSREETARLLQSADIFVHPSRHNEGIPLVLLEAGACGLAVIATDVGGVRELIAPGILVGPGGKEPLYKAIEKLASSQSLREELSTKLVSAIQETFSWKKASDRLLLSLR